MCKYNDFLRLEVEMRSYIIGCKEHKYPFIWSIKSFTIRMPLAAHFIILQEMCYCIPTFSNEDDMDYSFWEEFLAGYYTGSFREHENIEMYRDDLGYEVTYSKVSRRNAAALKI